MSGSAKICTHTSKDKFFRCSHEGCDHIIPQEGGVRLMHRHEARFQLHKQHFERCGASCAKCRELVATGEWSARGGRDDYMCRHDGCGYFSSSPRAANRKQAVERHEAAFPIHFNHYVARHADCKLCQTLLGDRTWSEGAGDEWLQHGSSQVISRLMTKEHQNEAAKSLGDAVRGDASVLVTTAPPKATLPKKDKSKLAAIKSEHSKSGSSASASKRESDATDDESTTSGAPRPKRKRLSPAARTQDHESNDELPSDVVPPPSKRRRTLSGRAAEAAAAASESRASRAGGGAGGSGSAGSAHAHTVSPMPMHAPTPAHSRGAPHAKHPTSKTKPPRQPTASRPTAAHAQKSSAGGDRPEDLLLMMASTLHRSLSMPEPRATSQGPTTGAPATAAARAPPSGFAARTATLTGALSVGADAVTLLARPQQRLLTEASAQAVLTNDWPTLSPRSGSSTSPGGGASPEDAAVLLARTTSAAPRLTATPSVTARATVSLLLANEMQDAARAARVQELESKVHELTAGQMPVGLDATPRDLLSESRSEPAPEPATS